MAGECSNLMNVTACASKVCQTEMAQGVRAEPFDMSTPRESERHDPFMRQPLPEDTQRPASCRERKLALSARADVS